MSTASLRKALKLPKREAGRSLAVSEVHGQGILGIGTSASRNQVTS